MFDEKTTFAYMGYKPLKAFRVVGNLGAVLMWKPTMFGLAFEKYKNGGAVHLGPLTLGVGPITPPSP